MHTYLEGTVRVIRESWPMEIGLATVDGWIDLIVAESCTLREGGKILPMNTLREMMKIRCKVGPDKTVVKMDILNS